MSFWFHRLDQNINEKLTNSALEWVGQNLSNFSLVFWSKRWHQKDILKLTDLYTQYIKNNHSLTKFDKRIRPSCSVDSMAILIVEFLWQILQEGIGQFLIEASITERQKTGILLNNVAEKNLKSYKKNINFEYKLPYFRE